MTQLNLLDAVVLLILLGSVVYSALKGFVRELLGMLSLVAAFFVSVSFYRVASEPFKEVVKTENIALFLGFASIFLGTLIVGALVIWAVQKLVKFAKVQWFDRLLGAAFGFIRGWILGSVVFLALTSFDLQSERVRGSQLAPYYLPGARIIALATPHDLKTRFMDGYRVVEKWWREHS
jgi:membrane protein required for colicin V production